MVFPATHPRAGEPTGFREKILSGEKIHTIRSNPYFWRDRLHQVNVGLAELSLRHWLGKPYASRQHEFARMAHDTVGWEHCIIHPIAPPDTVVVGDVRFDYPSVKRVARNDGLSEEDFRSWFPKPIHGIIIHLTGFRYTCPTVLYPPPGL